MKAKFHFIILTLVCSFTSCSTTVAPEINKSFIEDINLSRLVGKYQNLGVGGKESEPHYLSSVILPKSKTPDKLIEIIEVKKISENILLIEAKTKERTLEHQEFVEGKDFEIKNGRIWLGRKADWSFAHPAGNPLIGHASNEVSLGIDESGNGKFQSAGHIIGTLFVIIPVVLFDKEEISFKKIEP